MWLCRSPASVAGLLDGEVCESDGRAEREVESKDMNSIIHNNR